MRRTMLWGAAAVALLAVVGCSDTRPTESGALRLQPGGVQRVLTEAEKGQLDQQIMQLIQGIFPTGLVTAAGTRWDVVKAKADAGDTQTAQNLLTELTKWVISRGGSLTPVPTTSIGKLVVYMAAYVNGTPTDLSAGADAVYAIVSPDGTDPAPIVTPSGYAGVDLKMNAVNSTTVIAVVANPTTYATCAGPLAAPSLCQIPRFYRFEAYPHEKLNEPATFGICDLRSAVPTYVPTPLRLAHTRPASPANYSAGAIQIEGAEILKAAVPGFLTCDAPHYPPPVLSSATGAGALRRFGNAVLASVSSLITPKNAWAVDLGGGGEGSFFSDFAIVGGGTVDLQPANFALSSTAVVQGNTVTITWNEQNGGTWPSGSYTVSLMLSPSCFSACPAPTLIQSFQHASLSPTTSAAPPSYTYSWKVPSNLPNGSYTLSVMLDEAYAVDETNESNNAANASVWVGAIPTNTNGP